MPPDADEPGAVLAVRDGSSLPPGGVANLGDPVQYELRLHNQGTDPVTLPSIDDHFARDDYDFVSASSPPDVSKPAGSD